MLTTSVPLLFGSIGGWEVLVIFLVVLLLFGAKRLPEIARAVGQAINEFKKTKDNLMDYKPDGAEKKINGNTTTKKPEPGQSEKNESGDS